MESTGRPYTCIYIYVEKSQTMHNSEIAAALEQNKKKGRGGIYMK